MTENTTLLPLVQKLIEHDIYAAAGILESLPEEEAADALGATAKTTGYYSTWRKHGTLRSHSLPSLLPNYIQGMNLQVRDTLLCIGI